jgi:hypothetical protein
LYNFFFFQATIKTELYPRSQIDIFVEVLQADGGNYCACVNAATLALIDAGIPLKDYVTACTASLGIGYILWGRCFLSQIEIPHGRNEGLGGVRNALSFCRLKSRFCSF